MRKLKTAARIARSPHGEVIQLQVIQSPVRQGTAADGKL